MTNSGEQEVPSRGGGASLDLLSRILQLEEKTKKFDVIEQEINTLKSSNIWRAEPITDFAEGYKRMNEQDGIMVLKDQKGNRRIDGLLTVLPNAKIGRMFTVPEGFGLNSTNQAWVYAVPTHDGPAITLIFSGRNVSYWSSVPLSEGIYVIEFSY